FLSWLESMPPGPHWESRQLPTAGTRRPRAAGRTATAAFLCSVTCCSASVAFAVRFPQDLVLGTCHVTAEDEQQVRESVEVLGGQGVDRSVVLLEGGPDVAFGAADDDPCLVQQGHGGGTSGQEEAAQCGQVRVVVITGLFQACDVLRKDPKRWVLGVLDHGGGQVGTEVEQLVLDAAEQVAYVLGDLAQSQDQADGCVGLLGVGVADQACVVLAGAAHVTEGGGAAVPGTGVDLRQYDRFVGVLWAHAPTLRCAPKKTSGSACSVCGTVVRKVPPRCMWLQRITVQYQGVISVGAADTLRHMEATPGSFPR